jgi:hypothetical protein
MATTALEPDLKLSPTIGSLLGSLRGWIRVYVWLEGLAVAVTWLGVAFWGSLAVDWFFEPPPWVRGVMLAIIASVLGGILVQWIVRRAFVRLSNSNMAMLLERHFPHLDDSLLTAVALTEKGSGLICAKPGTDRRLVAGRSGKSDRTPFSQCNRHMLAHTCRQAAERVRNIGVREVFNPLPLGRAMAASGLLGLSVVSFALLAPDLLGIWARRNLTLDSRLWPRRASLFVEGFEDGVAKVARGADLEIIAKADTRKELPTRVVVRYRIEGGRRDRKPMMRVGAADPAKDPFQEYSFSFRDMREPVRFDVVGEVKMGHDVCVPDLRIEVVESPTVDAMSLHCKYPSYMQRQPRVLPVTGQMQIPRGTEVTVDATANKDLISVQVDCVRGDHASTSHLLVSRRTLTAQYLKHLNRILKRQEEEPGELLGGLRRLVEKMALDVQRKWLSPQDFEAASRLSEALQRLEQHPDEARLSAVEALESARDRLQETLRELPEDKPNRFQYKIDTLDEDTTLMFTLLDVDEIKNREPVRLTLAAVADYPPQLSARLEGIGAAITPQARLPAVGQITDDYGIAKVWYEYTVDQQKPGTHPLSVPPDRPTNLALKDAALEVRDLKLTPGQKLLVGLKAADFCDLAETGNVGASERWLLDLVTPDQLRAMLESRELVLRQRLEAIIQEVTETRDLLLRVSFGPAPTRPKTAPPAGTDGHRSAASVALGGRQAASGAEPGDEPEPFSLERQSALRGLRVQRALTNSSKNAHETEGVADGIDDIRLQLVNNRIDTEELIRRLQQGIAEPLHRVAQKMFPQLQSRLERLQESLDDETLGPQRRDLARETADAILLEMTKALDRMIELEDFNQAVELLRTIIKLQEQLGEQTKQRHKQKIRELLEDKG